MGAGTATAIESIEKPEDAEFITLVRTDCKYLTHEKSIRKNVTIPAWLSEAAENAGLNFSQALQYALTTRLHIGG